jgi:hypothetical protein
MNRFVFFVVTFIALIFSASTFAGEQDFLLVNDTGLTIDQFYCSAATTDKWEEDILGVDVLPDSESVMIQFSHTEEECIWDFMIVDQDGEKIYWKGIDLCEIGKVTLYYHDGVPTAQLEKAEDDSGDSQTEDDEENEE